MATDLNRELLGDAKLLVGDAAIAGPNDLVLAVRAADEASSLSALQQAETRLSGRRTSGVGQVAASLPRSMRAAHRVDPEAQLAVISVPGQYAAAEARLALADG